MLYSTCGLNDQIPITKGTQVESSLSLCNCILSNNGTALAVYYSKTFKKVMNVQTPKEKSTLAMWFMIENSNNIRL